MPTQQSYTFASHTSQPTSQSLQKSMPAPRKDKFNFFSTHSRHISSWTETAKTYTGQGLTMTVDRRPACKSGFAKKRVQCSADTFVVKQSLVLRINLCCENRHLRQAQTVSGKQQTKSK